MIDHRKDFEFSLNDKLNFSSIDSFPNLGAGEYVINIRTADNCAHFQQKVTLEELDVLLNMTALETKPTCGEANGSIELIVPDEWEGFEYALLDASRDTTAFQSEVVFDSLNAGFYVVFIKTPSGCIENGIVVTLASVREVELDTVSVVGTTCGLANGSILLQVNDAIGIPAISINGNLASDSLNYTNLDTGSYNILVTDDEGCQDSLTIMINGSEGISIVDSTITQPTCGLDNGALSIQTNFPNTIDSLTLNGAPATLNMNAALAPGTYLFTVKDDSGCTDELEFILAPSEPVEIITIDTLDTRCALANGAVSLSQSSGNPTEFSIDGITYFSEDSITAIPAGNYLFYAQNENCADTVAFTIDTSAVPELMITDFDGTSCGEDNGSVDLSASGGSGSFEFLLDSLSNITGSFDSLPADTYVVFVRDITDCIDDEQLSIASSVDVSLGINVTNGICGEPGILDLVAAGGDSNFEFSDEDQVYSLSLIHI